MTRIPEVTLQGRDLVVNVAASERFLVLLIFLVLFIAVLTMTCKVNCQLGNVSLKNMMLTPRIVYDFSLSHVNLFVSFKKMMLTSRST